MENQYGFNFLRKIWHVLGLGIPIGLYFDIFHGSFDLVHASRAVIATSLGVFLFSLLILEIFRLTSPSFESFFYKYFGFLIKESERHRFQGTVPYFLANFFVVLFFPPEISVLSILFLVVGDPIAAYVGSRYGKNRFYNGKSREGIIGFFVSAFIIGLFVLLLISISQPNSFLSLKKYSSYHLYPILILFLAVLASCLTEFFVNTTAKGLIDDNLLIPIVGAIVLSLGSYLFITELPEPFIFNPMALYLEK